MSSGGGWTGDLIIADWHDIENHVASEVHVERFKSKELGMKKLQEVFGMSLRRWLPKMRRSRTTSNVTPRECRELRRGRSTLLLSARQGVTLGSAQEGTLCKMKAVFQTFLKLIVTLRMQVQKSGVYLGIYLSPSCHAQRTIACNERVITPNSGKIH